MNTVYTVGHSNRDVAEFLALLASHDIEEVVDVRRFPGSRRQPWFGQAELAASLAGAGIGYVHVEALGGRRGKPQPNSPNTGWRVASFQAYADHMTDPEWLAALARLEDRAAQRTAALMCSEAVPWRCHRRLIADALVVRGWQVLHILGTQRANPHTLQDFARVQPDGRIIYPAEKA